MNKKKIEKVLSICMIAVMLVSTVSTFVKAITTPNEIKERDLKKENNKDIKINEIVAISGNEKDGYYIGYKEGIDEFLKKTSKRLRDSLATKKIDENTLLKIFQAELISQYPDLGGKIGKEVKVSEIEKEEKSIFNSSKINSLEGFLFIGDSITVGLESKIQEAGADFRAKIGVGSIHWINNFSTLPDNANVKGINFHLGANDYGNGFSNAENLLDQLKNKYPGKKIFVNKILPQNSGNEDKGKINEYNNNLKTYCNNNSNCVFIDTTKDVQLAGDGVHPTPDGYNKLWENINDSIKGDNSESEIQMIIGKDTGKGRKGFQGGVKLRRVTPNKEIGEMKDVSAGEISEEVKMSGDMAGMVNYYLTATATEGKWSVYLKGLKDKNEHVKINSENKQYASNMIDLFIMAAAYKENKVDDYLIENMIVNNDLEATDELIDRIGIENIQEYLKDQGYKQTEIVTKVNIQEKNNNNYTSAEDVGKLLYNIYNNKLLNSKEMLNHIKKQKNNNGIKEGVEEKNKSKVYSKVGINGLTRNEAAIIDIKGNPYCLVIMGDNLESVDVARIDAREISKKVYKKLNKDKIEDNKDDKDKKEKKDKEDLLNATYKESVHSKVYNMEYVEQKTFDKMIKDKNKEIIKYYTIDGKWNIITAKWNYNSEDGIEFIKNTPINYQEVLKKYMTPFEYLINFYVDTNDRKFITDFANIILDSQFVISLEDNVTTTETLTSEEIVYEDGDRKKGNSSKINSETVTTNIEFTYIDTWFTKFWKDIDYMHDFDSKYKGEYANQQQKKIADKARSGKAFNIFGSTDSLKWVKNVFNKCGYSKIKNCCPNNFSESILSTGATSREDIPIGAVVFSEFKGSKCLKCKKNKGVAGIYVGNGEIACFVENKHKSFIYQINDWIDDFGWTGWGYYPGTKEDFQTNANNDLSNESMEYLEKIIGGKFSEESRDLPTIEEPGESKFIEVDVKDKDGKVKKEKKEIKSTKITYTHTDSIKNKYESGESHIVGNEKKFLKLFESNIEAKGGLKPKWLFRIMERNERTAPMIDLTKYLLYCLDNDKFDFGVYEFDFSRYKIDSFNSLTRDSGKKLLKEYIRYWEHSTPPPTNADGTKYIIENDGDGNPVVGYGVDIFNGEKDKLFVAAGFPTHIGGEVDIEFVDELEENEMNECYEFIAKKTESLNLTGYQINALVSRAYNCGMTGAVIYKKGSPPLNFVDSYQAYWDPEKDDRYKEEVDYGALLYQNYMWEPVEGKNTGYMAGLERRRKSEWRLFQTGYYDVLDKWHSDELGGDIIECADYIHKYMEQNQYVYSTTGHLDSTFEKSKTGQKNTCCATYVSWVLQEAGYVTEEEHNTYGLNGANNLAAFLKDKKDFQEYTNPNEFEPGDVLWRNQHVEIYAGEGKVYNAGSNNAIRDPSPKEKTNIGSMKKAYRAPN